MRTAIFKRSQTRDQIISHALDHGLSVLMIKDEGLYLMVETLRSADGKSALCAFAEGCDPELDSGWYDKARAICGGDDFLEQFDPKEIAPLIRDGADLVIDFSDTHMTLKAAA